MEKRKTPPAPPTKSEAAAALGRLGGSAGTPAQDRARRRNAKLAGRPRRVCTTCGEPVIGGHQNRALDETCGAHGWCWQSRAEADAAPKRRKRAAKR